MPQAETTSTLAGVLDRLTVEGELYERLPDGKLRCVACGHRCVIFPGKRGICQVRFNDGGTLRVPWGYVAALQCDPTEKKPFNHVLPGSLTLTFGMLGCDYHCPYCFRGDTVVLTSRGPVTLANLFKLGWNRTSMADAEVSFPREIRAVTASGSLHPIRAVFKHPYRGPLLTIRPYYLPALRCTPDHRVYATIDPRLQPEMTEARHLTLYHYLAIPQRVHWIVPTRIDVVGTIRHYGAVHRVRWRRSLADRLTVAVAAAQGERSRQTAKRLGVSPSHLRNLRRKVPGGVHGYRVSGPAVIEGSVRFRLEHGRGIPAVLELDENLAELLGYYVAEGSISRSLARPNSIALAFSFGPAEESLVERTKRLLDQCFAVKAGTTQRETNRTVSVVKASLALLFEALAGSAADGKRVPPTLFGAPGSVARAFLDAYVKGDGSRYDNGKVTITTVSRDLAYGIGWLVLRLGFAPSIYEIKLAKSRRVPGREVKLAPAQYTVVWYEGETPRKLAATNHYYLVPIRQIDSEDYQGDVYNMEVEEEHTYLANFFAVSNCQNWLTSQALRDPLAGIEPHQVSPEQMIALARRCGAHLIGSSYNEPLITSEWAIAIFKEAHRASLHTCYISNGNATPQVLGYLRPWTDCYKIDLKAFNDKNYRLLGGTLASVLTTIKMVHEMGFWTEIVTLVVPGYNDSDDELRAAAEFIASVSPLIPWHVTAFHKDYKMMDPADTPPETLIRAARIGEAAGLKYVYAGNLPGRVGRYEHTFCHHCRTLLVERHGYLILQNRLARTGGHCPDCRTLIPGIWNY